MFLFSSLFCTDKGKILSGIEDGKELKEGNSVPFLLQQNFPNPFNSLTRIDYNLAVTSHVKLKVFTEDWQEVAILVNQTKPAGTHSAMFNYSQKKDLHSGEYYYVMEVLGVKQIRKMKLIE